MGTPAKERVAPSVARRTEDRAGLLPRQALRPPPLFCPPFWPASEARWESFAKLPPLSWPPFWPASEARWESFAKLPPLSWPPFWPASEARCGSFAKLPWFSATTDTSLYVLVRAVWGGGYPRDRTKTGELRFFPGESIEPL